MNQSTNKVSGIFPNLLLILAFALMFMYNTTALDAAGLGIIYYQFILSLFSYIYIFSKVRNRLVLVKYTKLILIVGAVAVSNFLFIGNVNFKSMLWGVIIYPSISLLLYTVRIKKYFSLLLFAGLVFYIMFNVLSERYSFGNITHNSENYISFYLMLFAIPYYVYCSNENVRVSIFIPIICLAISLLATGRGGIIATGLLTAGTALLSFSQPGIKGVINKITVMIVLYIFIWMLFNEELFQGIFYKFDNYGFNSRGRTNGWTEYINSLNYPINWPLGTPIKSLPVVYYNLGGSLHNSYLTIHSRYGFVGVMLIFCLFSSLYQIIFKYRDYSIAIIMICLLEKAFTDSDFAAAVVGGDIYVFFLLFIFIDKNCFFYGNKEYTFATKVKSNGVVPPSISSYPRE